MLVFVFLCLIFLFHYPFAVSFTIWAVLPDSKQMIDWLIYWLIEWLIPVLSVTHTCMLNNSDALLTLCVPQTNSCISGTWRQGRAIYGQTETRHAATTTHIVATLSSSHELLVIIISSGFMPSMRETGPKSSSSSCCCRQVTLPLQHS